MKLIVAGLLGMVISFVLALAYSLPVMWLWNAVVPHVFGVNPITWLQALWLSLLCGFLFKTTSTSVTAS